MSLPAPAIFELVRVLSKSFWIIGTGVLFLLLYLSLWTGSTDISFGSWYRGELSRVDTFILLHSRLPRTLVALMGGAALALAGLLMQTLFRNHLAGPSVLGVSTGGALAVAAAILGFPVLLFVPGAQLGVAVLGSVGVLLLLLALAPYFNDINSLLIVGIMIGFIASALIGIMQASAGADQVKAFAVWGFGSFARLSSEQLLYFATPLLAGGIAAFALPRTLDLLLLGELHARSMGVHMQWLRVKVLLITGVLTGTVTAFCGPIAFLGLAAPHLARLMLGTVRHEKVLPATLFCGALLALACDVLARWPWSASALPLNAVCALLGAPVVLALIFSKRKKGLLV